MKKIIKNFVVFKLLEGLAISFFFATYSLFLRQKGLDPLEINILNGVCMIAIFLFEIPTGAISDFFGRKISVVIGLFVYSLSFLMYFFSDSFWYFAVAEIIGAMACACVSGAMDAMLVDSLQHNGHSEPLEKIFSRGEIKSIGIIVGSFFGGLIGSVDLAYPWLASSIGFFLLAFFVMYSFKEDYFVRPDKKDSSFKAVLKIASDSVKYGLRNRNIMSMVLFFGILSFVVQPLNMYWPFVLKDNFSFSEKDMGIFFPAISISTFLGSRLVIIFFKKVKNKKKIIILSQIITFVGIFGSCLFLKLPLFLSFFLLHEFGRGALEPLKKAYINDQIDNKNRATVLSFESMIVHGGAGLGLIFSGIIAKNFGSISSWLVSAIILAVVIIVFYKKR